MSPAVTASCQCLIADVLLYFLFISRCFQPILNYNVEQNASFPQEEKRKKFPGESMHARCRTGIQLGSENHFRLFR